jgi:hypothetical protein
MMRDQAMRAPLMRIALGFAAAATLAACGGTNAVNLSGSWPDEPRSYDQVTRDWTREDKLVSDFDAVIEVHATFKSPEWRTAYVARVAKLQSLQEEERAALLEAQKQAAAKHHEFELLVSTYNPKENDLQKGARSQWRIVLADDQGNEVTPANVKRDRRPRAVIESLFPTVPDFAEAYEVKFPRDAEVLRPDAKKFTLTLSGVRGAVKMVWADG